MSTVVALGGNALMRENERGTAAEQLANLRRALPELARLLEEPRVVVTHGNGPQVGNELLRQERAADEAPPLPLWLAVAQTQAEIGTLLPAMGYGRQQMDDLRETIARSDAELVLIGTPIDLRRIIELDKPALRVTYKLQEMGEPTLRDVLVEKGLIEATALV